MNRALALVIVVVGLLAPAGVMAQDSWETMHPGSFPSTTAAARQQCDRTASQSAGDALTAAACEQMELMLATGQCPLTSVPDGTVFSYMNYQHPDENPSVQGRTIKRLGSDQTQAAVCDLGNGVVAYWFNESGVGCNNVAFQIPRRQTTSAPPPQIVVAPPRQLVCEMVLVERIQSFTSGLSWHVPGFHTDHTLCGPSIDIPSISGSVPGSTGTTTRYVRVCH